MSGQHKNHKSLSFEDIANIIGKFSGVTKDVEKAEILGLSQSDFANRKKRGAIPYGKLIEWALANDFDLNALFTDRDVSWQGPPGEAAHVSRGTLELSLKERQLLDDALEVLRAQGQDAEYGDTLKQTIRSLKKALEAQKKIPKPRSKRVKTG